ncbi:hypothetical protein AVEN_248742-1, partial [Araneus ventricosus]
SFGVEL